MNNIKAIIAELNKISVKKKTATGDLYLSLDLKNALKIGERFGVGLRQIEIIALKERIVPERYQRNMGTIGNAGQLKLLQSAVAVIGLGGLGGLAAQLLARMGVGKLIIVDGDTFADSNLNRQVFATGKNIDESKAEVTASLLHNINSATEVVLSRSYARQDNLPELLADANVALDCLDSIPARFDLQQACSKMNIIMVHGAVAGFMGQLAVIRPGENLLANIYPHYGHSVKSVDSNGTEPNYDIADDSLKVAEIAPVSAEAELGNPAATPAIVAAWQVSETVKILTNQERVLKGELLHIDLQYNETTRIPLIG